MTHTKHTRQVKAERAAAALSALGDTKGTQEGREKSSRRLINMQRESERKLAATVLISTFWRGFVKSSSTHVWCQFTLIIIILWRVSPYRGYNSIYYIKPYIDTVSHYYIRHFYIYKIFSYTPTDKLNHNIIIDQFIVFGGFFK